MKRFITEDLLKWKESKERKPLILKGARQVGKTYILKEFGSQNYSDVAYFNLSVLKKNMCESFGIQANSEGINKLKKLRDELKRGHWHSAVEYA